MQTATEQELGGRDRSRLRRARADGYLNAMCRAHDDVIRAFSFWCWKLRLPVVWFVRNTPRSKYGRVSLDLFTTPSVLTTRGEIELKALGRRFQLDSTLWITAHDASWDHVPVGRLEELARAVLRIVTRNGNCQLQESEADVRGEAGSNVIPLKRSA
jgi:hypothetical protein